MSKRINICVASPDDVSDEREAVLKVLNRWNNSNETATLNAVMWERAAVPELGDHPQHILNQQIITKSDLLVAILWSKLGTQTPTAESGTVEEIREFIESKGAKRVMIYFCTRAVPMNDLDPSQIASLQKFKNEIKEQGVYHEYDAVNAFERDLYQHLDVKVRQFLNGELPQPVTRNAESQSTINQVGQLDDYGNSLADISTAFAKRMDEFDSINGLHRTKKYRNLAAIVYRSVADSIDRALSNSNIQQHQADTFDRLSTRLKRLANNNPDYKGKPFNQYWDDGRDICDDLATQVSSLSISTE